MTAYSIVLGLDVDPESIDDLFAGSSPPIEPDPLKWKVDDLSAFLHDDLDDSVEIISIERTP